MPNGDNQMDCSKYRNGNPGRGKVSLVHNLTRIRLQLAVYFCLYTGKFAGKHCKLASVKKSQFGIAVIAHRDDGKRFVVHADEKLTAFGAT
jgi:hypothetical protein